jgi:hypothetical protein
MPFADLSIVLSNGVISREGAAVAVLKPESAETLRFVLRVHAVLGPQKLQGDLLGTGLEVEPSGFSKRRKALLGELEPFVDRDTLERWFVGGRGKRGYVLEAPPRPLTLDAPPAPAGTSRPVPEKEDESLAQWDDRRDPAGAALFAPAGCGKTTELERLAGLLRGTPGRYGGRRIPIMVDGHLLRDHIDRADTSAKAKLREIITRAVLHRLDLGAMESDVEAMLDGAPDVLPEWTLHLFVDDYHVLSGRSHDRAAYDVLYELRRFVNPSGPAQRVRCTVATGIDLEVLHERELENGVSSTPSNVLTQHVLSRWHGPIASRRLSELGDAWRVKASAAVGLNPSLIDVACEMAELGPDLPTLVRRSRATAKKVFAGFAPEVRARIVQSALDELELPVNTVSGAQIRDGLWQLDELETSIVHPWLIVWFVWAELCHLARVAPEARPWSASLTRWLRQPTGDRLFLGLAHVHLMAEDRWFESRNEAHLSALELPGWSAARDDAVARLERLSGLPDLDADFDELVRQLIRRRTGTDEVKRWMTSRGEHQVLDPIDSLEEVPTTARWRGTGDGDGAAHLRRGKKGR